MLVRIGAVVATTLGHGIRETIGLCSRDPTINKIWTQGPIFLVTPCFSA